MDMIEIAKARIEQEYQKVIAQAGEIRARKLAALDFLAPTLEGLGGFVEQTELVVEEHLISSEIEKLSHDSVGKESKLPVTKQVENIILGFSVGENISTPLVFERAAEKIPKAKDSEYAEILRVKIAKVLRKLKDDKVLKLTKIGGRGEPNIFQKRTVVESENNFDKSATLPFDSSNENDMPVLNQPETKISKLIGRLGQNPKNLLKALVNSPTGLSDEELCKLFGFNNKLQLSGVMARIPRMANEAGIDPETIIAKSYRFTPKGQRLNYYSIGAERVKDELKRLL